MPEIVESEPPSLQPIELSFPAPKGFDGQIHVHMTALAASTVLFLTSTSYGDSALTIKSIGSFVCAVPDRISPKNSLCTTISAVPSTVDFASRSARILSLRMKVPVYVGCSIDLAGYTSDEEMDCLSKIIEVVMARWKSSKPDAA